MNKDIKWFKFGGACVGVAENELAASLNDCSQSEHEQFIDDLYAKYVSDGEPRNLKIWLKEHLGALFPSAGERPRWIEGRPAWPWLNGKPMVFLGQLPITDNDVSASHVSKNTVLYIFGSRATTPDGWEMKYRVVDQRADLKGLVAVVESELLPHTPANTKLVKRKT